MPNKLRRRLILVLPLAAAAVAALWAASQDPAELFCRAAFEYYLYRDARFMADQSRSGLSSVYYFQSYYLNGMLSAAEGLGSERVLRKVMRQLDAMQATVVEFEFRGRRYLGWRPFSVTADTTVPKPNLHFTFQATVPFARAAAVIMGRPRWKAKYGDHAKRYVRFIDETIIKYWYYSQLRERVPWGDPEHFPIWNDNGSNLGLIAAYSYQASGDPLHKSIAERIGRALRRKLQKAGNGWIWEDHTIRIGSDTDNTPGSVGNQAGVPDTSHANREAFLLVSFHEAGLIYGKPDIERMAATLTDAIWNGSEESPSFSNYINGSDVPYRVYKQPGLNGSIYHGWALMGGYSPKAQRILFRALQAAVRGPRNPSLERNYTSYGAPLALSGHLLRNFAILKSTTRE